MKPKIPVFLKLGLALAALLALPVASSLAALKCQELTDQRICRDNTPRDYPLSQTRSVSLAPPVSAGFDEGCWRWDRKFQCVEANPVLTCESGRSFDTVRDSCSLVGAVVRSTVTINNLKYITDAEYTYKCDYQDWTCDKAFAEGVTCVALEDVVTPTATAPAASAGTVPSNGIGSTITTAPLASEIVTAEQSARNLVCYQPPVTNCTNTCKEYQANPVTGVHEEVEVPCKSPLTNCVATTSTCDTKEGATSSDISVILEIGPDGRCVKERSASTCQSGEIPRCLTRENCEQVSAIEASIQANGFALAQQQTYLCSNETESCAQYSTINSCMHISAWGFDDGSLAPTIGEGLGEVNAAMAKLSGLEKGIDKEDLYIFSGQTRKCSYAVGSFINAIIMIVIAIVAIYFVGPMLVNAAAAPVSGAGGAAVSGGFAGATTTAGELAAIAATNAGYVGQAANIAMAVDAISWAQTIGSAVSTISDDAKNSKAMGKDCCKTGLTIEGSDGPFKATCTEDEIKLAVARQKGLFVYLGEYCSKKGGSFIKECKEKTQTYCTFDDMLALTVNKQGRQQLDAIANADVVRTTASPTLAVSLYAPLIENTQSYAELANGHWIAHGTHNKSQIWTWQWPGYCRTPAAQAAAYATYNANLAASTDTTGWRNGQPTSTSQALDMLAATVSIPAFQPCPAVPGELHVMTCSKTDDSCDASKLPPTPNEVAVDEAGAATTTYDMAWTTQGIASFALPGGYGALAPMPTDSGFAAVPESASEFVTAVGSCHTDGDCRYYFSVTDKTANNGWGAKKRVTDTIRFPMYGYNSVKRPTITWLKPEGSIDAAAKAADIGRGAGSAVFGVGRQRFIARPHDITAAPISGQHTHVLLEWAHGVVDSDAGSPTDYEQLLLPISLPPATEGWWPYGNAQSVKDSFYISGGCDTQSKWCTYDISVDFDVERHPWGTAKIPRCWGFTMDQLAALDFDKMDLSRWIDSLNLDKYSDGLTADAAKAMNEKAKATTESFYTSMQSGAPAQLPGADVAALTVNSNTLPLLSSKEYSSYTLVVALPSNWPRYYDGGQANTNPVTNAVVDWGDGTTKTLMSLTGDNNRAFIAKHDYGDAAPGTYKLVVTLDTQTNGAQTLSTNIRITPNAGSKPTSDTLDFNNYGNSGSTAGTYVPSNMINGSSQAPAALESAAPGMAEMYERQGATISK